MGKSKHASQTKFERARRKQQRQKPQPRRQSNHYDVIRVALKES